MPRPQKLFTDIEISLRTAKTANKNKPYSLGTLDTYKTCRGVHEGLRRFDCNCSLYPGRINA